MCCCFSPASTTLKKNENPVFITLVHQHLKKKQQQQNQNNLTLLVLTEFFFFCLPARTGSGNSIAKHHILMMRRATPSSVQLFFSPLCEIFCAQLLNNTWKHMKWKKNSSKISSDLAFQKNQTKQKLASVVMIIYYKMKWYIQKKIMSLILVTKFHVCALQKASTPRPAPALLNATIFLFIYIISSLCLKQRKKMEQISEKNKTSPSNRERKKKKVDVNEKKTEDTSSRHRLFSIYWAWKYDIKNFSNPRALLAPLAARWR